MLQQNTFSRKSRFTVANFIVAGFQKKDDVRGTSLAQPKQPYRSWR